MSGYGALNATEGTPGSALEVFVPHWNAFRGKPGSVEISRMAVAILAGDVPRLGELISRAQAMPIRIDRDKLPPELPRRPRGPATLLDIAPPVAGRPAVPARVLLPQVGHSVTSL
jgi:hypothetical protein